MEIIKTNTELGELELYKKDFCSAPLTTEEMEDIMKDVQDRIKFPYFLSSGTALGLYRDKKFIDGDNDFDIVFKEYDTMWEDMLDAFSDYNFIRGVKINGKPHGMAFQKGGATLHIVSYWEYENEFINADCTQNGQILVQFKMPKEIFSEMVEMDTKYGKLPFPNNIELYLEKMYGDWKTPR